MAPGCWCDEGNCNCYDQSREVIITYDLSRPNTPGNRMGDYVAQVIDTSIEKINGLWSKLKN